MKKKYHVLAVHTNVGEVLKALGNLHKYPVTYRTSKMGRKQGIECGEKGPVLTPE